MNVTTKIDNYQDVIDSRQVIERIDELQAEREALEDAVEEAETEEAASDEKSDRNAATAARAALTAWDESESFMELKALLELQDQAEGYAADWKYGEALIRDSHFKEYAQELAEDCGMLKDTDSWPNRCIDWDQAARELQMDYTAVDFDGVTYWIR